MKLWWVLGYYHYYPNVDNFRASFETQQEAIEYVTQESTYDDAGLRNSDYDGYEIINIGHRL